MRLLPPYAESVFDESAITAVRDFMAERDWGQFHSPASLARSIAIEAGELLECFQWSDHADQGKVEGELADVLTYCLLLADTLKVDPSAVVLAKLEETRLKYPIEVSRGNSERYDQRSD
ncbi:nucleotide pyrophosphohydrolase [Nocardioides sp. HDW12B]|nr:nucleotide pyrophosphohydrolase [Nocardioides sp. HDW12B]